MKKLVVITILICSFYTLFGQNLETCKAYLQNDTLTLENSMISRKFLWNEGNLISISLTNKNTGQMWEMKGDKPDTYFIEPEEGSNARLETHVVTEGLANPHLVVNVINKIARCEIKREYKIYPDCPAIAYTLYLKGFASRNWKPENNNIPENRQISYVKRKVEIMNREVPTLDRLALTPRHWSFRSVELGSGTDRINNLLQTNEYLSYVNEMRIKGNILIGNDLVNGGGFFIVKESPPYLIQLSYPGCDFVAYDGVIEVFGFGMEPYEVQTTNWTRCYGTVTGVHNGTELGALMSLRNYEKQVRRHTVANERVMSNNWGDNNRDEKVGEKFCLAELEAGARLGLKIFQIDAGWDETKIYSFGSDLRPSKERFPNGFAPLTKKAEELDMEIGLWMNLGSNPKDYRDFGLKLERMVDLYKNHNIKNFKLDFVRFHYNEDMQNVRAFLDSLMIRTDYNAFINLDVTNGSRYGLLYFNEYGNFFVENRYTDARRYYPHWSLRQIWQLSKYVPPERLQMEFLNKWRNDSLYDPNEPFRPSQIPFEYCFATTMAAQPLAWMETSGLPPEAFKISGLVKKYREVSFDFHGGYIFPIGDMPNGRSWTGFQSIINDKEGYLLIYREYNDNDEFAYKTFLPEGVKVKFVPVLGDAGNAGNSRTGSSGTLKLSLPKPFSFAMYHYYL